ncbi:MAG: hypothetical protein J4G05_04465 [Chlorobi bacterium]|nr:hypothetical protein [Chlorobiota bacterium]
MGLTPFDALPDHAQLWAFTSGYPLSEEQKEFVENRVREFLGGWAAHGTELTASTLILHNRFLLIGVDQDQTGPSGCSIDAMTRFLRELGKEIDVDFLDAPNCCYRDGETIRCVDRITFGSLANKGAVDSETTVFNLTVPSVGELRAGSFEQRAGATWYAKAFRLGEPAD